MLPHERIGLILITNQRVIFPIFVQQSPWRLRVYHLWRDRLFTHLERTAMLFPGHRLAFSIDDLYSGLARVNGLLSLTRDDLVLEFQTQDNLVGVFKGRAGSTRIPIRDIYEAEVKSSWLNRFLIIRPKTLSAIAEIPGADESELKVKFKKRDLNSAKEIASYLNLRISEIRLEEME